MVQRSRKRNVEIKFFITPKEKEELDARVKKTGLSRRYGVTDFKSSLPLTLTRKTTFIITL